MKTEYQIQTLHISVPMPLFNKIKEHRLLKNINEITTELWAEYIENIEDLETGK